METLVAERRRHARVAADEAGWRALRLRTGDPLALVNIAAGGALVESSRRLLPGTTVILLLSTDQEALTVRARVVRCSVHALGTHGVLYQGALAFADELDSLRTSS